MEVFYTFMTNLLRFNLTLVGVILSFRIFLIKGVSSSMARITFINLNLMNIVFRLEDANEEIHGFLSSHTDEESVWAITNSLALVNLLTLFAICAFCYSSMSPSMRITESNYYWLNN
jgi:hypothetical protein